MNSSALARNAAFRAGVDKPAPQNDAERIRSPLMMAPGSARSESLVGSQAIPVDSLTDARIEAGLGRCVTSSRKKRSGFGNASPTWWSRFAQEKAGCPRSAISNGLKNPGQLECRGPGHE